jgi:UDP-N-acetylglucosamine acyltransferase
MAIHPTAIVDRASEIDPAAEVGAYAIVERGCKLAPGVRLYAHAYVGEGTTLGEGVQVHPFAVVGHLPQDLKFKGEPSYTVVGARTVIREHATIHRGAIPESTTEVGADCFIMSTGHIAHNCIVGNNVIVANGGLIAGHCEVGQRAFVSGNAVIHQFCRIGEFAMVGGGSVISMDILPFMLIRAPDSVAGINVIGLRRAGFSTRERSELQQCHRILTRDGLPLPAAIERVAASVQTEPGRRLLAFLRGATKRGILLRRTELECIPDVE